MLLIFVRLKFISFVMNRMGRILFVVNVENNVFGIMWMRKLLGFVICCFLICLLNLIVVSEKLGMIRLLFGFSNVVVVSLINSVSVVIVVKMMMYFNMVELVFCVLLCWMMLLMMV